MKNLKIGLILFLGVLVSGKTNAMGTVRVNTVPGEQEKIMIDVLEAPQSSFVVEMKDNKGEIIYRDAEETSLSDCKNVYNLSDLNNGKYTLDVKLGNEEEIDNLVVKNGNVEITGQEEQVSPYFKLDGKFLEFTFPNATDQSARLLLYNNDSKHWVFQEELNPEFDIQQALNLSELKPGSYKALLISGEERYNYNFQLG